jgi:hypothetical protein
MTSNELYNTFESMRIYGGGFCRQLSQAWLVADLNNRARIERAFPHLLEDYGPGSGLYRESP